jgi:hypothetical protein
MVVELQFAAEKKKGRLMRIKIDVKFGMKCNPMA